METEPLILETNICRSLECGAYYDRHVPRWAAKRNEDPSAHKTISFYQSIKSNKSIIHSSKQLFDRRVTINQGQRVLRIHDQSGRKLKPSFFLHGLTILFIELTFALLKKVYSASTFALKWYHSYDWSVHELRWTKDVFAYVSLKFGFQSTKTIPRVVDKSNQPFPSHSIVTCLSLPKDIPAVVRTNLTPVTCGGGNK